MRAREALIGSMIELMRRHGVAGTGVSSLLEHSGVSRRAIYLSFPGGKAELVAESTRAAGGAISAMIGSAAGAGPLEIIESAIEMWRPILQGSGFRSGCPIVAAVLGRDEAPRAGEIAAGVFDDWEARIAGSLRGAGLAGALAASLATVVVAAIEGGVVLSQAAGSLEPLERVGAHLGELIGLHLDSGDALPARA